MLCPLPAVLMEQFCIIFKNALRMPSLQGFAPGKPRFPCIPEPAKGLRQGIWQTKVIAGINPTDKRATVPICSKLKRKPLPPECALLHSPAMPLLALSLRLSGTVLAKYVVQHSLMLKQRETNDRHELLRGWPGIGF
jgi:hypothetical protein